MVFANIAFEDTRFRASGFVPFEAKLPMILGNGAGGVVVSVSLGPDDSLIGRRVVAIIGGSRELQALPHWMPRNQLGCRTA